MDAGPPLAEVYGGRGGDGASAVDPKRGDASLKPFTDPRTGKAMRAIDRVDFAVATLQGDG
jgi:hypothetical protein